MRVLIRADASTEMGSGHVARTKTLAAELVRRGADVNFVCRRHVGNLISTLREQHFEVTELPAPSPAGPLLSGYANWLGVTQELDAHETIAKVIEAQWDCLIVDHYGLGEQWELALRQLVQKIMVIDDLADRKHNCDLLLDQSFTDRHEHDRYEGGLVSDGCDRLLGPRYALLQTEYAEAREHTPPKAGPARTVLIFFGGTDESDLTGLALEALSHPPLRELAVDVVVGPNYQHMATLNERAVQRGSTRLHRKLPHLADLMATADMAIGGGGTTTWERLCLGLPSLVVSIAENQTANCRALEAEGLIKYLGSSPTIEGMRHALEWSIANIDHMRKNAERGQRLVDGLGAKRVAEVLLPSADDQLSLRTAALSDATLYFVWANEPRVRANSLQTREVQWDDHVEWFAEKLGSPRAKLYVLQAQGLPLGQIRVEEGDGIHWLNYSLDPIARGRGWGRKLIELGCQAAHKDGASAFRARVKQANVASAALLLGLGFEELTPEDGIRLFEIRLAERTADAHA